MDAMPTSTKAKVSNLVLVYPPISNQEAVWLKHDSEVEAMLRGSDFYMIGGRAEATFDDIVVDPETMEIRFQFVVGDAFSDPVVLNIRELPTLQECDGWVLDVRAGPKMIQIFGRQPDHSEPTLLDWFTTEKLVLERARGRCGIEGFERFREASTYDLLYVGIAKVGDTFDRLLKRGHTARTEILSNEPQRYPGARVTDEIYLFMFTVEPLIMTTFEPGHDFSQGALSGEYDAKRNVADAEKAFVHLLKPHYNNEKFANYPKGKDGLYSAGYERYAYTIGENVTFNTAHGQFKGGRDPLTGFISNDGDSIFVEGDLVRLFVAGVDHHPAAGAGSAPQAT